MTRSRSKGHGPERCQEPSEIRPAGLPATAICTEPRGGSDKRSEQEEEEEGGPNKRVPQRTLAGSNPAWAPCQRRKLPAAGLESDAGRLINSRSQMRKGKVGRESAMRAALDRKINDGR